MTPQEALNQCGIILSETYPGAKVLIIVDYPGASPVPGLPKIGGSFNVHQSGYDQPAATPDDIADGVQATLERAHRAIETNRVKPTPEQSIDAVLRKPKIRLTSN